jgi:hypothetical protein
MSLRDIFLVPKNSAQIKSNKAILLKMANLFDDPFSKYIEKNASKLVKNYDLQAVLQKVKQGDKQSAYLVLSEIYVSYYLSVIGGNIFSSTISGNINVDNAFKNAVAQHLRKKQTIKTIAIEMKKFFDGRLKMFKEEITVKDVVTFTGKAYNWLKAGGNKEKMVRYQVRDKVLGFIHYLNGDLKREINNGIMKLPIVKIKELMTNGIGLKTALNLTAEIIFIYILEEIKERKLKNLDMGLIAQTIEGVVLDSKGIEKNFIAYLEIELN